MRRFLLRIARIAVFAFLFLLLWSLPYGPLFPWSPIKPGYDHLALVRADVYWPAGKPLEPVYRTVDRLIEQTEREQGFAIRDRLTVVHCANWADFHRFSPTTPGTAVGAVTLDTGTVIYVSPKVAEMGFSTREFLLHELSHADLHQQSPRWRSFKMDKWAWLFEGIAVSNGRQTSYLSAKEFVGQAGSVDFTSIIGPPLSELPAPLNMRFNYVAWRYFLEYMKKTRGEARFRNMLKSFLDSPDDIHAGFARALGISVRDAAVEFQAEVLAGKWQEEKQP